jgi:hypothetical protein
MRDTSQTLPAELLIVQLLEWVAVRPRCYADVMDAWRTSCPRLPVWEAAVDGGLVRIESFPGVAMGECAVVLTAAGRQALTTDVPGHTAMG